MGWDGAQLGTKRLEPVLCQRNLALCTSRLQLLIYSRRPLNNALQAPYYPFSGAQLTRSGLIVDPPWQLVAVTTYYSVLTGGLIIER